VRFTCTSVSPKVSAISSDERPSRTRRECLPPRNLVGIEPRDILDQRGFERGSIVARGHHRTRQFLNDNAVLGCCQRRVITPLASDDLIGVRAAVHSHDQRHQDSPRPYGRQDVGEVRGLLHTPHVDGRDAEFGDIDVLEFHGPYSFSKPHRPRRRGWAARSGPAVAPNEAGSTRRAKMQWRSCAKRSLRPAAAGLEGSDAHPLGRGRTTTRSRLKRDLHRRIADPAMRYLIVTARAAETRQGLGGAKRNRAGSRQRRETPNSN
jgi:hypothetical protein